MRLSRIVACTIAVVAALTACGYSDTTAARVVQNVSLALADTIELGQETTARAIALDQYGDTITAPILYSSSEPNVASINAAGVIFSLTAGTTQIHAALGGRSAVKTLVV